MNKTIFSFLLIFLFLIISCNKDDTTPLVTTSYYKPNVETAKTYNITDNSAMSGGFIVDDGGSEIIARGVCWSISQNPTLNDSHTNDGNGTGVFESLINGLVENTEYYIRAYATNSEGTDYGLTKMFITEESGNVYHGDVILKTQDDVNYFGENNYTKIEGDLEIGFSSYNKISDLTPLLSLNFIDGNFKIHSNEDIINLVGLNNISTINGYLRVENCENLHSLNGFNNLVSAKGLILNENPNLSNIYHLNNLEIINGSLYIEHNNNLTYINGLNSITTINNLSILNNNSLVSINGLNNLTIINEDLNIGWNNSLITLDGINNLTTINHSFRIFNNNLIENLDNFNNLTSASEEDGIQIILNKNLSDFCGLVNLYVTNGYKGFLDAWGNAHNPNSPLSSKNCSQ